MQIVSRKKYFKMGFKLSLFPFFVLLVLTLSGFKQQPVTTVDSNLLFDTCFGYLSSNGTANLSTRLKQDIPKREVKDEVNSLSFLTAFSDTTDSADSLAVADSLSFADSLSTLDSSNVQLSDTTKLDIKLDAKTLDSLANAARLDSMAADSTARLEYFKYQPKDVPYLQITKPVRSKFLLSPSKSLLMRTVKLDSTGQFVIIREKIGNSDYRDYMKIPIDDYIDAKMAEVNEKSWDDLGKKYELKSDKKELSQLITDITNIEIPLPSSSIFSIFGPPKINIRINGAVDIHGAWRNETTEGVTLSALGNTRNEPDFKQKVQISVNGTIGDKLTIAADWNTERTFQYENQLKIKYTGYEDEIIQSIEAGNVSLQTSPLVGGSEALFGIKAHFQMGPFSLTALASQKKGEIQEVSLSSGAQSQTYEIHAWDYSQNHFFLDTVYASTSSDLNIFNKYYGNSVPIQMPEYFVRDIEVWKSITGLKDPNERSGNAFIDLPPRISDETYTAQKDPALQSIPGEQVIGFRFVKMDPSEYTVHKETGFISFNTQLQSDEAIAVAYRRKGSGADDIYYGEFTSDLVNDTTSTMVLKLIKPPNLQPKFTKAWKLQLKNIYFVGGRELKQDGFTFDIEYLVDGKEPRNDYNGIKLLHAFGLDNGDEGKTTTTPDGLFDFTEGITIMTYTGEIIFPVLQPFGKDFPTALPDTLAYQAVYDTTVTFAKQDRTKDKFLMVGEYSADVTSTYNIGFNVVENSVRVRLNGQPLEEGIDYSVDYNIGQITIRNDNALVPGADLRISYEQNDLFQLASKTLMGLRGIYQFNKNTRLGFSLLDLNQKTLSDKVRIGEEPLNNTIFGADFETSINLPFLTKGLDNLISTKEMSMLSLKGEYAYMSPDPNTKKSTIDGDGGKSIAYIDDFEGAKKIIPIGVNFSMWKDIAVPKTLPIRGQVDKTILINSKAKSIWYNILPSDVTIYDIWADRREAAREDQQITVLNWDYDPSQPGAYNWNPDLGVLKDNWGGIMTKLSSTASNLTEENIGFIEFWMKIVRAPSDAKLYIDLGQISEDVIPNNDLDTEDKNGNYLVDDGEDTGIDGNPDTEEPNYNSSSNPDPSHDNYYYVTGVPDFSRVNGTQGNAVSIEQGRIPDTEDLNGNQNIDLVDSYFRYEIPIDTVSANNPMIAGGGDNAGWYLIRVPLKDYVDEVGSPSFSVVETIRFMTTNVSQNIALRFAEINLVGNQWQKVLNAAENVTEDDEVLELSTISYEDNTEYVMPPGLKQERDRSITDATVYKNEQSLRLVLDGLEDGAKREVVKYLYKPLDIFDYKEMKLFVHGDVDELPGSVSYYQDENNYGSKMYFRFGADSLNYYEYSMPIKAGWREIRMVFDELTAIKQGRASDSAATYVAVPDSVGHYYAVRGNPTLTRITFFTIGIVNPRQGEDNNGDPVSGEIWINELRVLNADSTPGWAYTASTSLKLADLMNVNFNISQTDPYFHKLAEQFGSRVNTKNWGISADFDVLKLIPVNLGGSNLKVSYSRTESTSNPLYLPGTDISVDQAAAKLEEQMTDEGASQEEIDQAVQEMRTETETKNVSETWTLNNVKIKIPSNAWYIKHTINSLSFGFNYNVKSSRNPTTKINDSWIWNANANYALNLGNDFYFEPVSIPVVTYLFDIFPEYSHARIYFVPQTITLGVNASRKRSFILSRTDQAEPNIQRDFTASRNASFSWRITEGGFFNWSLNYNLNIASSLTYLLTDEEENERNNSAIFNDILNGAFFGRDYDYKQTIDLKTQPILPAFWDINKHIRLDASYNVAYSWRNNFQQEELGKSAGYSNRINASLNIKLKSLFAPLFMEEYDVKQSPSKRKPTSPAGNRTGGRGDRGREDRGRGGTRTDKTAQPVVAETDTAQAIILPDSVSALLEEEEEDDGPGALSASLNALKMAAKYILFDYDQIVVNYSQTNSFSGGGLAGSGTGFNNFWGINYSANKGPSREFMLGMSRNVGPRAPNGNITDNFSHKNKLDFRTSRELWEGAKLDVNWNVAWGLTKSTTISTDSLSAPSITNITSTGTIDRSFFSAPPVFFLSFLDNGIVKVSELYNKDDVNPNSSLATAFVEGFETFPLLSKIPFLKDFAKYIPRPNWNITWTGLEKMSFFNWAKKISIDHAYTSSYSEGWKVNPDGIQEIQTQKIDYGFNPLIGLNITFNELWGGNLSGSIKYASKTAYNMGVSTKNITETFSRDIAISASYGRSGFEFPLFGVSLKNDLEISFSYTSGKNSIILFDMDNFDEAGTPQDGTTRTVIEPRIKYVMSSRVTLSLFYRRTSVEPEGASRITPTITNEAGLDVHISIQ